VAIGPRPRYRIEFTAGARKGLAGLPRAAQERIAPRITALSDDPRPRGVDRIKGEDGLYRIRVGDYRVVYAIRDDRLIVTVVRVGDRKDVYRKKGL
jgi:mRNA interferase RelE/StbE